MQSIAINSWPLAVGQAWPQLARMIHRLAMASRPPQQSHSLTRSFPLTATGIMTRCSLRWQAIGLIQRLPLLHARGPRGTLLLLGFGG
jgi:hypothetical protein